MLYAHVHIQTRVAKPKVFLSSTFLGITFKILHHFLFFLIVFVLPSTVPFLSPRSEALASLKSVIDESKELKVPSVRPLVLAAEENLHNMVVDLDKVITKVRTFYKL